MLDSEDLQVTNTDGITVSACRVLVDECETFENHFMWGYYLCIENNSDSKISLVGKDWFITDDMGNSFNDNTAGFKGEIPELEPGECFEFTSQAPLKSDNAVFYGSCKVVTEGQANSKDIRIPTFSLAAHKPSLSRVLN